MGHTFSVFPALEHFLGFTSAGTGAVWSPRNASTSGQTNLFWICNEETREFERRERSIDCPGFALRNTHPLTYERFFFLLGDGQHFFCPRIRLNRRLQVQSPNRKKRWCTPRANNIWGQRRFLLPHATHCIPHGQDEDSWCLVQRAHTTGNLSFFFGTVYSLSPSELSQLS